MRFQLDAVRMPDPGLTLASYPTGAAVRVRIYLLRPQNAAGYLGGLLMRGVDWEQLKNELLSTGRVTITETDWVPNPSARKTVTEAPGGGVGEAATAGEGSNTPRRLLSPLSPHPLWQPEKKAS